MRVIVVANETFTSALAKTVSARHLDDPPVRATVSADVAELRYTADLPDGDLLTRRGIARYTLTKDALVQIAPFATSRVGLIDEWLKAEVPEAGIVSTPEAMKDYAELSSWMRPATSLAFNGIEQCPDSTWQVSVSFADHQARRVFRIGGSDAKSLRIVSISPRPAGNCTTVLFNALVQELEWSST